MKNSFIGGKIPCERATLRIARATFRCPFIQGACASGCKRNGVILLAALYQRGYVRTIDSGIIEFPGAWIIRSVFVFGVLLLESLLQAVKRMIADRKARMNLQDFIKLNLP